jgi:hypothetical protein
MAGRASMVGSMVPERGTGPCIDLRAQTPYPWSVRIAAQVAGDQLEPRVLDRTATP